MVIYKNYWVDTRTPEKTEINEVDGILEIKLQTATSFDARKGSRGKLASEVKKAMACFLIEFFPEETEAAKKLIARPTEQKEH